MKIILLNGLLALLYLYPVSRRFFHGSQVRIGIEAPRSVQVHREKIFKKIKREEQGLSNGGSSEFDHSVRGADYFDDDMGNR